MFGWRVVQRKIQLINICLLLLLLASLLPTSNANKMQASPSQPQSLPHNEVKRIDVHRLYNAYRERVKEVGDDAKHATGLIPEHSALAEEDDVDAVAKGLKTDVSSRVAKTSVLDKELPDNSNSAKKPQLIKSPAASCEDDSKAEEFKCVPKQKLKSKESEVSSSDKERSEPEVKGMVILKLDLPSKDKTEPSKYSKAEQDSAERRIAELNRVYKEFMTAWKKPPADPKKNTFFSSKPIRLSALNELMNVVENLKQPNTMSDFVKAIDEEMSRESDKLQIKSESGKRMSRKLPAREIAETKTGGLYEQYRSKLSEILKAHKEQGPQKQLCACHCDAKKSPTLAVDGGGKTESQCHCDASKYALAADPAKLAQGTMQCRCEKLKSASLTGTVDAKSGKGNDYFEALEACMQLNKEKKIAKSEGPKPYFISNSKQRQMVWNDIPLVDKKKVDQKPAVSNSSNLQMNLKCKKVEAKSKSEQVTLTKNQKQLLHLLKVLQAKHQPNTKRSHKRGLESTQPNGLGFPQVLVNQPVPQQQPQGGNRMIDNMAKQMNVSPMEMAQRIASSSGSSQLYPLGSSANSARPSDTKHQTRLRRKCSKHQRM